MLNIQFKLDIGDSFFIDGWEYTVTDRQYLFDVETPIPIDINTCRVNYKFLSVFGDRSFYLDSEDELVIIFIREKRIRDILC